MRRSQLRRTCEEAIDNSFTSVPGRAVSVLGVLLVAGAGLLASPDRRPNAAIAGRAQADRRAAAQNGGRAVRPAAAAGQASQDGPLVAGQVGGPAVAIAARGGHAYLALGLTVVVLDVARPEDPRVVGRLDPLPCTVTDVASQGNVLYVVHGSGFATYDLADPASPRAIGGWRGTGECSEGGAESITLAGRYAYATGLGYLTGASDKIFDVSDPTAIRLLDTFDHGPKNDIAVADGFLYAAENAFLYSYSLADPARPGELGRLELGIDDGHAHSVQCAEGHVFVGTGAGLLVADIALPEHPRLDVGYLVRDVVVRGGRAYLASSAGYGLWIVDVSDPRRPRKLGSAEIGDGRRVALIGDYAYVASAADGLWVVDVSDPSAPEPRQVLTTWQMATDVALSGSTAFVAAGTSGLVSVDVSDPTAPRTLDAGDVLGVATDLVVDGARIYVIGERSGPPGTLNVFDATDPSDLRSVGVVALYGAAMAVAGANGKAYVADSVGGLRAFDARAPGGPTELGALQGELLVDLLAVGDHVYGIGARGGLRVVDVADPARPRVVGSLDYESQGNGGIALAGSRIYASEASIPLDQFHIGEANENLLEIDVSDPAQPVRTRSIELAVDRAYAFPRGIAVEGERAYVASGTYGWRFGANGFGLFIAPLGGAPGLSAPWRLPMPDRALAVAVTASYAVVADCEAGLLVVRTDVRPTPVPSSEWDTPTPPPGTARPTATALPTETVPEPTPTLSWRYRFDGRVLDGTGGGASPLSGAVVEIDFCGVSGKSAPTGADGLYQVDGFTSGSSGCGRVRYMVTVAGFAPLHEEVPEPPVHGAWNVVSRDVVLVRAGGRLYLPHAEQVAAGP